MPRRFLSTFQSVDVFGKLMPGVVMTFVLLTLLPQGSIIFLNNNLDRLKEVNIGLNVLLLLSLVFMIFIVGFVIGQALNTGSAIIERILYYLGGATLRLLLDEDRIAKFEAKGQRTPFHAPFGEEIYRLAVERYIGFKQIFKPHRKLFKEYLKLNDDGNKPVFESLILSFETAYNNHYKATQRSIGGRSVNAPPLHRSDHQYIDEEVYPLVVSFLDSTPLNRAKRFQASYTFCRSMWVILLFTAVVYLILALGFIDNHIHFRPAVVEVLHPDYVLGLGLASLAASVGFMVAAGDYKSNFVEYIFADFINAVKYYDTNSEN